MAAEAVLQLGKALSEVHELLAGRGRDGMFRPWRRDRCGFAHATTYKNIAAFKTFGKCKPGLHLFEAKALYLLSAESCPEDAAKEAIRRAKKGEAITATVAREIKAKHMPEEEGNDEAQPPEKACWQLQRAIQKTIRGFWQTHPHTSFTLTLIALQSVTRDIEKHRSEEGADDDEPAIIGKGNGKASTAEADHAAETTTSETTVNHNAKTLTGKAITTTNDINETVASVTVADKQYEVQQERGAWFFRVSPETGWTVASAEMVAIIEGMDRTVSEAVANLRQQHGGQT
jgi:hypothetical protein